MQPVRVVIVDDHTLLRKGVRSMLECQTTVEVVGEAENANGLLRLLETTECDVLLLDMGLPDRDGEWCTREVKKRHPNMAVMIVSMADDPETVMRAMHAGADGYITKSAPPDELFRAIACVSQKQTYIQPHVAGVIVRSVRALRDPLPGPLLTHRERDVLRRLQQGRVLSQISQDLGLSPNTVKSHLSSLYRKLEVSDRLNAVRIAVKQGLLPPTPADGPATGEPAAED